MRQRKPRIKDSAHLRFIRTCRCSHCGDDSAMSDRDPAHIRFSDAAAGKNNPGVGMKPDDRFVVPLCRQCHDLQHDTGDEIKFWGGAGEVLRLAADLYANSGDAGKCDELIIAFQTDEPVNILAAG